MSDGAVSDSQSITERLIQLMMLQLQMLQVVKQFEDQSVVVSLSGSDIDGDNLSFSLDS